MNTDYFPFTKNMQKGQCSANIQLINLKKRNLRKRNEPDSAECLNSK